MTYRIKDWQENFENERTSKFGCRLHIDITTKYNSYEMKHILKHKDGGWHFTFWILLLEWHSRTPPKREGWITHNGKVTGIPLTPDDLQEELRIPSKFIKVALEVLSTDPINWIAVERSVNTVEQRSDSSVKDALPSPSPTPSPTPTQPYHTIAATDVSATYIGLARSFLEKQREAFPKESAWKHFEQRVHDGAYNLELFTTQNDWTESEIQDLLTWVLTDQFWSRQIRTLGSIRIRKNGEAMKFENARASMKGGPQSVMDVLDGP